MKLVKVFSIFFVVALCKLKKDFSILSIVLSGIITSSLFISMLSILKFAADPNDTLPAIRFWLMGSFASSGSTQITFILLPFLLGTGLLYLFRWKLNILSLLLFGRVFPANKIFSKIISGSRCKVYPQDRNVVYSD